jgi:K+-sensing histidine kinase KdpD
MPVLVSGDKMRISQVLNNLLSIAINYSRPTSCIFVKSSCFSDSLQIKINCLSENILSAQANDSPIIQSNLFVCQQICSLLRGQVGVRNIDPRFDILEFSIPVSLKLDDLVNNKTENACPVAAPE